MSAIPDLDQIRAAAQSLRGQIHRTPLISAGRLSERFDVKLRLKLENQQATGSFKDRGAALKLARVKADGPPPGVIAMSAGNHAQGVAYHAQRLGMPATIVMPEFAPFAKVERTRGFGARVILTGDTLDESAKAAREIAEAEGLVFVHPYDDPLIVTGQGTVGLEILEDWPEVDCLVVPIGGGGLISGIALAAKALKPGIQIIGVESSLYPSMRNELAARPGVPGGQTIADGIAVKVPGGLTKQVVAKLVDDILLVDEVQIEQAILALAEEQKLVAEGAGAAGVAAIMANPGAFRGRRVASVICGGNIDMRLLSSVLIRGLVFDGRMVRIRVSIHDRPGALARVATAVGDAGGNIIEVQHQRFFRDVPPRQAEIDLIVETRNAAHVDELIAGLGKAGFATRILSSTSTGAAS